MATVGVEYIKDLMMSDDPVELPLPDTYTVENQVLHGDTFYITSFIKG